MRTRRSLLRALPVLALAGALTAQAVVAGAQTGGGDRRQQLQNQISEVSAAQADALVQLQAVQAQRATIDARVAELDLQVTAAEAKLAPLEAEAARLDAEVAAVTAHLAEVQAKLDAAQLRFDASAAAQYRSARRGSQYDTVLASRPTTMVQQEKYLDRVSQDRRALLRRVSALRDEVEFQRALLAEQQAKADAARDEAQATRDQIASLRSQIEPARAQAAQQQAAEEAALGALEAQKGQAEAELESLQAASDGIAARIRAHGSGPGSPGPCGARPVPGGIVSGFGMRYHPILHTTRMHNGVDFSAASGTPIHACRSGDVIIAESCGGYGNCVVIDHGGWMATLYAHQSRMAVAPGQHVDAGDVIGYVGSTGLATGPHLHFEVRLSGNPVDPAGGYL
jgi:murein DD-endopeptidase MepM/ murein hydrolase activator NlpD